MKMEAFSASVAIKPNDVHEGKWIGVGGKLEQETPQECAARNHEETGSSC